MDPLRGLDEHLAIKDSSTKGCGHPMAFVAHSERISSFSMADQSAPKTMKEASWMRGCLGRNPFRRLRSLLENIGPG